MKFKIGDKVRTNKIGIPNKGTIIGIMNSNLFKGMYHPLYVEELKKSWSPTCPNWENELVYYIKLDVLQRSLSFEEFKRRSPDKQESDYELLPGTSVVTHPEGDITP